MGGGQEGRGGGVCFVVSKPSDHGSRHLGLPAGLLLHRQQGAVALTVILLAHPWPPDPPRRSGQSTMDGARVAFEECRNGMRAHALFVVPSSHELQLLRLGMAILHGYHKELAYAEVEPKTNSNRTVLSK